MFILERILTGMYQWFFGLPVISKIWETILGKLDNITIIPDARGFVKNIGKLFVFNRFYSVFGAVTGIIAARMLGPVEFGKIGLIGSIGGYLFIPVLLGANNSMYKYLPDSDQTQTKKLIGTALSGNLLAMVLFGVLFLSLKEIITGALRFSPGIWTAAVIMAVIIAFNSLSESFLRGQKKYSLIGRLKLANSIVFFVLILGLYFVYGKADYRSYYFCNILATLFFIVSAITMSGFRFSWLGFSRSSAKKIYSLGLIVMLNMLFSNIINTSDTLIVNYFFPESHELGIYNVYQGSAKHQFVIMFFEVFAVVFFPTIAQLDKKTLYKKINKYLYWLIPLAMAGCGAMLIMTVFFYGSEYKLNLLYVFLVSVSVGIYSMFQIYNCMFSLEGNKGARLCLIPLAITIPISLILQFFFTKWWGILGTMVAVLITNILLVFIFKLLLYHRYKVESGGVENDSGQA